MQTLTDEIVKYRREDDQDNESRLPAHVEVVAGYQQKDVVHPAPVPKEEKQDVYNTKKNQELETGEYHELMFTY